MVTHLFEFISQDLDLFFIFILFLRVLWKRKGVGNEKPQVSPTPESPQLQRET